MSNQTAISTNPSAKSACSTYSTREITIEIISVVSALIIICFNVLLFWVIQKLADFSKFSLRIERAKFIILYLPIYLFVADALLLFVANFRVGTYVLNIFAPESHLYPDDINRKWYIDCGSSIIIVMLGNIFLPHVFYMLIAP